MFVHRKLLTDLWRAILTRARTFFSLQIMQELSDLKQRHAATMETLIAIERQNNILITHNNNLFARLAALETEQAHQWNNLSKLLLCIYQQPKSAVSAPPMGYPEEPENALSSILKRNSFIAACEISHGKAGLSELPTIEDRRPRDGSSAS